MGLMGQEPVASRCWARCFAEAWPVVSAFAFTRLWMFAYCGSGLGSGNNGSKLLGVGAGLEMSRSTDNAMSRLSKHQRPTAARPLSSPRWLPDRSAQTSEMAPFGSSGKNERLAGGQGRER